MTLRFGRDITGELSQAIRREWLVTNGIGGYAMGTLAGLRTRCYHGLLVAPLLPPAKRHLMVAAADVWIDLRGRRIPLITHEWTAGVILPDGYRNLESFELEGGLPVFQWAVGNTLIEQRLWMAHGKNTSYVTWRYIRGNHPIRLILKPLITYRSHHDITKGGANIAVKTIPSPWASGVGLDVLAAEYLGINPGQPAPLPFRIFVSDGTLENKQEWWWSFRLASDSARGMLDQEDLYEVAMIEMVMNPGAVLAMVSTTESMPPDNWEKALADERQRQQTLMQAAKVEAAPNWIQQLVLAADQFIVEYVPDLENADLNTPTEKNIIAGYPWFGIWGRVAMIGLPGLTLSVGRQDLARSILLTYARYVNEGMLPNLFIDDTWRLQYTAEDTTLWYFVALWEYMQAKPEDETLLITLYPILRDMIEWHIRGTREGIHVDEVDGLLTGGGKNSYLTWMDVKIQDKAVTPRSGKAVEVNALWYNALRILESFARRLQKTEDVAWLEEKAKKAYHSFNTRYWAKTLGYLYDVLDTPEGSTTDERLRPNQLFAICLPFRLIEDEERARSIVDICGQELLVSYGLRTLGRNEKNYLSRYSGSQDQRQQAYHQGVAWSWLLGPFAQAHYVVYKDAVAALSFIKPMIDHIADYGLGSIGEIFEGEPPFAPRGAVAYAASVAEVLRLWQKLTTAGQNP